MTEFTIKQPFPTFKELERQYFLFLMKLNNNNITHTATELGIDRRTIYRKYSEELRRLK